MRGSTPSGGQILLTVFNILVEHPSGLGGDQVIQEVSHRLFQNVPEQAARDASDRDRRINWFIDSSTDTAVKAGWLVKDGGGHWSLTSEGHRAYGKYYNDPEKLAREANKKSRRAKRLGGAKGLVALVAGLTTLLGALFGLYRFGTWLYGRTPQGQMAAEQKLLNGLHAGVDLHVFMDTFGMKPQKCNPMPSPPRRPKPWRQCTFTRKFEYVKLVVDKNAKVLQYAVTVRDPKFKPTFEYGAGDSSEKVKLGESTIAEVSGGGAEYVLLLCAASRFAYYEAQGGSHIEHYRYRIVGVDYLGADYPDNAEAEGGLCDSAITSDTDKYNVLGVEVQYPLQEGDSPSSQAIDEAFPSKGPNPGWFETGIVNESRSRMIVNTYAETAQGRTPPEFASPGVDEFDVEK